MQDQPSSAGDQRKPFFDKISIGILGAFAAISLFMLFFFYGDYKRNKLVAEAREYREASEYAASIPAYEKLRKIDPGNWGYASSLVMAYIMNDEPQKAMDLIIEMRAKNAKFKLEIWEAVAQYMLAPTDPNAQRLSDLLTEHPDDGALTYYLAEHLEKSGRYKDAGNLLVRLAKSDYWNEKAEPLRAKLVDEAFDPS